MNIKQTQNVNQNLKEENILVIKRKYLFNDIDCWQGLCKVDNNKYLEIIDEKKEFLPRSEMEIDPAYKQIIPYLIFTHDNKYFLMQRSNKAGEQRLKNKYSLGIGGHIREEDIINSNNIIDWATREFHEEIDYKGNFEVEQIGIINDDSTPVGQVHLGFALLLKGNSSDIKIKSELKSGELLTLQECYLFYDKIESWSQLILDYLAKI